MSEIDHMLSRIDATAWHHLRACGGAATGIADLLREIVLTSDSRAAERAWEDVFDSACHQGITIYDVTPALVPIIGAIATAHSSSRENQITATRFLAAIAMASEFCLPDGTVHRAAWNRRSAAPTPLRDVSLECRRAVASVAPSVLSQLVECPASHRAWYVALAVSVYEYVGEFDIHRLLELPVSGSRSLALAVEVLGVLVSGAPVAIPWLEDVAQVDESLNEELAELLEDGSAPDVSELARLVGYRLAEIAGDETTWQP